MSELFRVRGFFFFTCMVFLNAFVDLGHKITIQNTVFKIYDGQQQIILTAIVNALILLPFVLSISPAGFCADKFPKSRVMRASAWAAVILTLGITLCYYQGWFWLAFAMTFALALQSAFYSPAKYGYIKELVGKERLAQGNGIIQAVSTIAILAGIFCFSILFEELLAGRVYDQEHELLMSIAPIGWCLVAISLLELFMAYRLPKTQEIQGGLDFKMDEYIRGQYLRRNLHTVSHREVIFLSVIGLAIFWSISQVMLAAFPAHAKDTMGITNTVTIQGMMACAGIGIMLGSLIAGRVSRQHIETGLIPLGSIGIAVCLMILPNLDSVTGQILNFLLWGMMGGLVIIPLNALIQFHSGENEIGTVLAGSNFIQNTVMLIFLGITVACAVWGIDSLGLFNLLLVVAVGGTIYTIYKLPQSLIRLLLAYVIGNQYRLNVLGIRNIPESGGVLMLGNHISWIDWAIIQMASPRPIRFVMIRSIYERWFLKWFLDIFNVIPISAGGSRTALAEVTKSLNQGDVVCLFPEGTISRTGQLASFQRGFEKAAADANAVILPFYLRGLWGSWFSRSSEKLKTLRNEGVKRDIVVSFGEPMPIAAKAEEVKQQVFELSISSWEHYTDGLPSIPAALMESLQHNRGKYAIADSISGPVNSAQLLSGAICFADLIKQTATTQNVGLLVPTSSGGVIANLAALIAGKTVVNLNYSASPKAIASAIAKADIQQVYSSRKFLEKLSKKGIDLEDCLKNTQVLYLEDLREQISWLQKLSTLCLVKLLPTSLLRWLYCPQIDTETPAAILFSSGSEGEPKGVMLSHKNIMANLKQISDVLNTEDTDVMMATLPLFHAFGLTVTTFMPLIEGIPLVCQPDPTDAVNVGKAVAKYQATILCGTSTFLRLYTKNKRVHPLMFDSLRIVVAGAEKLNRDVADSFNLKFNKTIYEGYGATETTPVASVNVPDTLDANYWQIQLGNKPGTVGMPLPGTSFRIVDPQTMANLPTGEDGLILIGGTQVMLGYLNEPVKTTEVIAHIDGKRWYKTGDKGHLDEDGFLTIVDRYSRFAKLGGEMISLTAIEESIRDALAKPELELVAVNLPDDKKGEKVILLIEEALTQADIKQAMLDAKQNPLMIPAAVIQVEAIPKLGTGKTDFTTAKKLAAE